MLGRLQMLRHVSSSSYDTHAWQFSDV
jgi:hypothetical protein